MCESDVKLTNEELEQVSGGSAFSQEVYVIRVQYTAMDSISQIRDELVRELSARGIRTNLAPSVGVLLKNGMTSGNRSGVLVYECRSDGTMIRCYQG